MNQGDVTRRAGRDWLLDLTTIGVIVSALQENILRPMLWYSNSRFFINCGS